MKLPKCPFFHKPCLKEGCTAYHEDAIYVGPVSHNVEGYDDGSERVGAYKQGECWFKMKSFCEALRIELPQKK